MAKKRKNGLKWKKVGNKQIESVSKNKKYDFVIDSRQGVILSIFKHNVKEPNKAFIDSIEFDSIKEAQKEAEDYK